MQSLDKRLAELRTDLDQVTHNEQTMRTRADELQQQARIIEAEIRGIETALAALQPQAGNGAEPPRRRERRDIKALVGALLTEGEVIGGMVFSPAREAQIAQQIGCKASRVRAIVEALRKEVAA